MSKILKKKMGPPGAPQWCSVKVSHFMQNFTPLFYWLKLILRTVLKIFGPGVIFWIFYTIHIIYHRKICS